MTNLEQRLAVLENEVTHHKHDLDEFFEFVRRHMEREEKDRAELIELIQQIKRRGDRQAYFISGVGAAIAVIWTVLKVII